MFLRQRCWCESGSITIFALIQNISEGGLFVRTSAPLYEGARTKIRWALAPEEKEIEADAVVVWRRAGEELADKPAGMGLKLETIAPDGLERIREFVKDALYSGG